MKSGQATASDVGGKTVLVRADFSAGVASELGALVGALARAGARVAVIAGFGAPSGEVNPVFSLLRFRTHIEAMARVRVRFIPDCVGPVAEAGLSNVPFGEAALMENLRFHPESSRDKRNFAIRLSVLGDYFAISGPVPKNPVGWLSALATMLPAPPGFAQSTFLEAN